MAENSSNVAVFTSASARRWIFTAGSDPGGQRDSHDQSAGTDACGYDIKSGTRDRTPHARVDANASLALNHDLEGGQDRPLDTLTIRVSPCQTHFWLFRYASRGRLWRAAGRKLSEAIPTV